MNEVEKMRTPQLADMSVPEIQVKFKHPKRLLAKMRVMSTYDEDYRSLLEELVPGIPATSVICPPFHCDLSLIHILRTSSKVAAAVSLAVPQPFFSMS